MPEPTNAERAGWAFQALDVFAEIAFCGRDMRALCREDGDDALRDLACNLLHLARLRGMDPDYVLRTAAANFQAEEAEH